MAKHIDSYKKRTTISIDQDILNKFKDYCKNQGMKLSPKIELFMASEILAYEKTKK